MVQSSLDSLDSHLRAIAVFWRFLTLDADIECLFQHSRLMRAASKFQGTAFWETGQ